MASQSYFATSLRNGSQETTSAHNLRKMCSHIQKVDGEAQESSFIGLILTRLGPSIAMGKVGCGGYSWPCSPWPGIFARPGLARPEASGHAWAATVARGTAQARPDGPVLNGSIKNIAY